MEIMAEMLVKPSTNISTEFWVCKKYLHFSTYLYSIAANFREALDFMRHSYLHKN